MKIPLDWSVIKYNFRRKIPNNSQIGYITLYTPGLTKIIEMMYNSVTNKSWNDLSNPFDNNTKDDGYNISWYHPFVPINKSRIVRPSVIEYYWYTNVSKSHKKCEQFVYNYINSEWKIHLFDSFGKFFQYIKIFQNWCMNLKWWYYK